MAQKSQQYDSMSIKSGNYYDQQLDLIDRIYFNDFNNNNNIDETANEYKDIVEYELKTASQNKHDLNVKLDKLAVHRDAVNKRVSDLILQNSRAYSLELQRVSDFKLLLEESHQMCAIARRSLHANEHMHTRPSLKLIRKQMKKTHLINLYKSMHAIRELHNTSVRIDELIRKKEFSDAARTCFECDKALARYEHFKCIKDIKKRLKEYLEQIEQALDSNLVHVCTEYDELLYERIVVSYKLLNKLDSFTDKLNTQILAALNTTAIQTLVKILVNSPHKSANYSLENLKRKEYSELCLLISQENYRVCLMDLCNNLWSVMKNYYQMFMWHNNYVDDESARVEFKKKFSLGLNRVWQDVQLKISVCFRAMCFDQFKFDDFIEILTINNRFIELGQDYCSRGCDSQIMLKATKDQTLAFFKSYHVTHLEELKMFMENETWQLCPVKTNFSIFKLHEYKFLKENKFDENHLANVCVNNMIMSNDYLNESKSQSSQEANTSVNELESLKDIQSSSSSFDLNHNITEMLSIKSPFDTVHRKAKHHHQHHTKEETNNHKVKTIKTNSSNDSSEYSDSDEQVTDDDDTSVSDTSGNEDDDSSLEQDKQIKTKRNMFSVALLIAKSRRNASDSLFRVPMLTNTTLNIMRLFGKYIQMLSIFRIISNDVISYLMQLFYFYFYYIYMHFAQGEIKTTDSVSLEVIVKNIKNDLFVQSKSNIAEPVIASIKVMKNRQDYLSSINERIVAAESLVFLAEQLETIFPLINECLPLSPNKNIDVYLNVLKETPKIRQPIYMHISRVAVDYAQICDSITRVNWDLHDIMSQHNNYVDVLLRQIQQMVIDIESLKETLPIEKRIVNIFLEQTIRLIMRTLVEGYASIKKCSNEGRALMQLDFQQLIVKLEKLFEIRPIPDRDYVEVYIKAYYLPDSSIEKWVKEHSEYSAKHIIALINTMAQVTRKTKLVITSSFDNL